MRDEAHDLWAFGAPAQGLGREAGSVEAPDFTLPDVDGRMHSLSDYRGRKIFLLAWGSY